MLNNTLKLYGGVFALGLLVFLFDISLSDGTLPILTLSFCGILILILYVSPHLRTSY